MNKQLLVLVALVAIVVAGGYNRGNKIVLQRSNNKLNFACGGTDATGNANYINSNFDYTFKGCPNWLAVNGAELSGTPPAGTTGSWQVTVEWKEKNGGANRGSSNFWFCFADTASKVPAATKASVYFVNGKFNGNGWTTAPAGNYVVLLPFLTGGAVSGGSKPIPTGGSNCKTFETKLAAAQAKKTSLVDQQTTAKADYAKLDATIADLKAQQKKLKDQIGSTGTEDIDAQIATVTASIKTLESQIIADKKAADSAAAAITQAQEFVNTATANKQTIIEKQNQYNANKDKIEAAKAAWDNAQAKATAAQDAATTAQAAVEQATSASTSAAEAYRAASAKVADLRAQLEAAIQAEAEAKTNADAAAQAIADAQAQLDSANSALTAAQNDAATAKKAYDDVSTGFVIIDFTAELAKADQDIAGAQAQLDAANTANQQAQAKYAATTSSYESAKTQLADLQAKRDAILAQAGGLKSQLASINKQICDAEAKYNALTLTIASLATKISHAELEITRWTLQLKTCQQTTSQGTVEFYLGPIVGDASCGGSSTGTSTNGTGKVTFVGYDYVIVNGCKIYLGTCSNKVYRVGKSNFKVDDNVDYEVVSTSAGKIWAKKVACK